jgi:hypothetical protein
LEAIEARESGEWDKALELLRRWGESLEPAVLSFVRGTVWQEAGDSDTASLFYQYASELHPIDENFTSVYSSKRVKTDP